LGGILLPAILLAALIAWPFFDRSPANAEGVWFPRQRNRQNAVFAIVSVAIVILIIVGLYLRGPYWHLYWPWSPRPVLPRVL